MAQAPTQKEVDNASFETKVVIERKKREQQAQGKDFVIDEHGHAAGVIPEDVWKGMKA